MITITLLAIAIMLVMTLMPTAILMKRAANTPGVKHDRRDTVG